MKVKTIEKFLESSYVVDTSRGHVHDLPKSQLSIDVEHGYGPKYTTICGKGDILAKPRKKVKKTDETYLATDPDREGEATDWHLQEALKLGETGRKAYCIMLSETTKSTVREGIKYPREIDMDLVDAQQVRRTPDRMVGYSTGPLLWAKVKRGLSVGRVQSVTSRMICDREAEIEAFVSKGHWPPETIIHTTDDKKPLKARYHGVGKEKMKLYSEAEYLLVVKDCEGKLLLVQEIKKSKRSRKVPLPFTTSTLQQEASKRLNFLT